MLRSGPVVLNRKACDGPAAFWQEVLHYVPRGPADDGWLVLRDPAGNGPNLAVQQTDELKFGKNRMHIDLYAADQKAEVERLLEIGATVHRPPEEGEDFVILADPEGKLFCIVGLDKSKYWREM